ncbi:MAG TPA: nucleotidyltransferase domain-containing protein [Pseudolabrys sp.]
MRRDEIIARLKKTEPKLRAFGVAALYLFGSYARDEARTDSDVDVFVDPTSAASLNFLNYMNAYETIRKSVGEEIDIGYSTREGLSPYIRANIENEAVRVF